MGVGGVEGGDVFLCESCQVCVNKIVNREVRWIKMRDRC
jgi:hypothetical protein